VGYAHYVAMVDPVKGKALRQKARALEARYGRRPAAPPRARAAKAAPASAGSVPVSPGAPPAAPAASPGGEQKPAEPPKKKWWKLF
jgi:hypothetical protein